MIGAGTRAIVPDEIFGLRDPPSGEVAVGPVAEWTRLGQCWGQLPGKCRCCVEMMADRLVMKGRCWEEEKDGCLKATGSNVNFMNIEHTAFRAHGLPVHRAIS